MFKKLTKPNSLKSYQLKRNTSKWIVNIVKFFFIAGMCYLFLFPVVYLFTAALQHPSTTNDPTIIFVPTKLTLENFEFAIQEMNFWSSISITLLITVFGTLASLISCAMVGYGFARFKFFENKIAFMLVDLPVPASPKRRQLFAFLPSTKASVLSINFFFGIS